MGSPAFTPPPLSSHSGPADFVPPPLSTHAGPEPTAPPIGIRPASPWESIASRFHEFIQDPLETLTSPIPGSEEFQQDSPMSEFALGGIAPGGATLREFQALPKSKGLAKLTNLPANLIEAYRNASSAARAASAARVAQTAGQEMVRAGQLPTLDEIRNLPIPPASAPTQIPGLEGWKPFKPTRGAVPKFTPGPETPELGVSGGRSRVPNLGEGSLVPPASVPDLSGLPEPAPGPFKPNPRVAKTMRYSSGSEVPEIGVGGRNPGLVRRTPFVPASAPAVDITTGEELVPAPKTPKTPPIPPIEPKGSPVPPNSATFRHPADFTDLIRQYHATHPKGTSLRTDAQNVYGLKPGTMPTYEQALAIHEWRLRNPGKSPTAADLK